MKRLILLLLTAFSLSAGAQVYNNEWIDYSKTYYKFRVGINGIYRINSSTLASIGLDNVNADHFQLWRNGEQVAIYTSVQNAPLGGTGYIEFWGDMNDGKPDKPLYREPDYQLFDKFSLQTDSAAFFLTVNPNGGNLRFITTPNNVAGNTLPVEPFFMYAAGAYYKDRINQGRSELVGTSYTYSSSYDYGEGWTSLDIANGASKAVNLTGLLPYTGAGAPDVVINVNAVGNAVNPRAFKVKLNGDSIYGRQMDYYDYTRSSVTVPISRISAGSANIEVVNLCANPGDRMALSHMEIVYPRQFNFNNLRSFYFELQASAVGNYLEITNYAHNSVVPVLYDITNNRRYLGDITNKALTKFALPPSATKRRMMLIHQQVSLIPTIASFQQRDFINYGLAANQGDYLIISNKALTAATGAGDPVEDYRAYRSSPQGGSYNAKVYLFEQLEDQFGLGIKKHPLAIRNFIRWARVNYSAPLKNVLLIGKGVMYSQFRAKESDPDMEKLDLVPTFGNPASDILLTAEGNSSIPLTPIGRISAISKDEVSDYLDKVKQYEQLQAISSPTISDKAWMKNVVHVTGASDNNTSDILLTALNGHKTIIEDTFYAGNVHTFTKNSAEAVEQVASVRLENLFREGIGLLTYFGHSSASTLEFNLDNPQSYDNQGKYPVFIVMGCNAGSFYNFNAARFSTKETISEKFVLAKDRGAIAFMASTHLGIVHYLDIYNSRHYRAISKTHYGETLGEIMDDAIRQVFGLTTENDFYARFQCEQFTLHGDPAIKYYSFAKPDYVVEDQLVKISPSFITVSDSTFNVKVNFMNLGKAINKDIIVEVKRTYPDGVVEVIRRDTISFTKYMDSLSYNIPIIPTRDRGLNKITVTIDAGNSVDELYETNNSVTKEFYVIEEDVKPVYPYNYSIVNQPDQKLIVSSADPFALSQEYLMEIDTTELFDSPSKISRSMTTPGGVFEFSPGITYTDSMVYYWRVAVKPTTGQPVWNTSSFQYIANGEPGFSQAHYYQHMKSDRTRLQLAMPGQWTYTPVVNNLFVANGVWASGITQESQLLVNVNDSSYIRSICDFGFTVNVFDKNTFKAWKNQVTSPTTGLYGSAYPGCAPTRINNFEFRNLNTPATGPNRIAAAKFLRDSIPDGSFVVVRYTPKFGAVNQYASVWANDNVPGGNNLYDELKSQGFTEIDSMNRPRAFSFVYQKNAQQIHAPEYIMSIGIYDPITLSANCVTPDSIGYITSPKIGPAKSWKQLHWRGSTDALGGDTPVVDIYGINSNGTELLLMTGIDINDQDHDISSIDAKEFPFVRLKMKNADLQHYSPYQLRYWMLTYTPVPEGAIAPNIYLDARDSVGVGEVINFGIAFKNISKTDFDSVKVKFTVTDKDNKEIKIDPGKQKALVAGDTIKLNVPIDTRLLAGSNTVFVNFNPDSDQPEEYLFNNYAYKKLYVRPDSLSPVMDVTFDGTHILNRDIVSSKPHILVKLTDELKGMVLNDTSAVIVNVRYPDGNLRRYYFNNSNDTLQFAPAQQGPGVDENTASVRFNPYFLEDGEYELIVLGKDRSGNFAGGSQYKVSFMVINKPMISNMLNYPNPFTTSTAFVFTLTGSDIPQNIRIQVLTITGKIVREITKDELGPLHIGRNITEFKWDGTDQYGQKLANGIYLYRVITNLNGKSLDKYKVKGDDTDKYFNKGYGKMYLMR
ncbi:MAG: C25 family cysteine peptidase [Chitinophagaceae bacterium]